MRNRSLLTRSSRSDNLKVACQYLLNRLVNPSSAPAVRHQLSHRRVRPSRRSSLFMRFNHGEVSDSRPASTMEQPPSSHEASPRKEREAALAQEILVIAEQAGDIISQLEADLREGRLERRRIFDVASRVRYLIFNRVCDSLAISDEARTEALSNH